MPESPSLIAALLAKPTVRLIVSATGAILSLAFALFSARGELAGEVIPVVAFHVVFILAGGIAMTANVPWVRRLFAGAYIVAALICTARGVDHGLDGVWTFALAWFTPVIAFGWLFAASMPRR